MRFRGNHSKKIQGLVYGLLLIGALSASVHSLSHLAREQVRSSPVTHQNTPQQNLQDDCLVSALLGNFAFEGEQPNIRLFITDPEWLPLFRPQISVSHLLRPFGARAPPLG